jgi:hypothetical protein
VGLLLGPAACILVVHDDSGKLGDRCHFAGDTTTACGVCIAHACQKNVDACCASKSCRDDSVFTITKVLDLLDQCSTGQSSYSCRMPTLVTESSTEGAVFSCIQSACATECATGGDGGTFSDGGAGDGSSGTTSRTRCTASSSDSCSCYGDGPFNDTPCDITTIKNSLCCADLGWPGSGLRCSCDRWECRTTSTGCECSSTTSGPSTSCTGSYCCRSSSYCRCGNTPCSTSDDEVSSCAVDEMQCSSSNDAVVSSCAVPY